MASTSSGIPDLSLLIQDLLSNSLLPSTTPALISYHLSTAPPASLTRLADVLATSYALWNRAINKPYSTLDWKPATEIFEAVRNGIVYRASQLSTTTGTGYLGRRAFSQALDGLYQGIVSQDDAVNPFIRLLLTSGILAGVQAIKARRDKLYVGSRSILGNAEQQVLDSWSTIEQQKVLKASYSSSWSGQVTDKVIQHDSHLLSCWLAAQVFPAFSVDRLATGPVSYLLNHLSYAYSCSFANGALFAGLSSDLSDDNGSLHWNVPSPSSDLLTALVSSPLHQNLGPLSRAIGRCVEASPRNPQAEEEVRSLLRLLLRLSGRMHADWESTRWAEATEAQLSEATRKRTEPWTLLKSFLFSQTLILSSLLLVVSPPVGRDPTPMQRELACGALHSLQLSYFVTLQFGPDGFEAWKELWLGLVHVIRGSPEHAALVMRSLEAPHLPNPEDGKILLSGRLFYLNVAEHLSGDLTAAYVHDRLLPATQPYLTKHEHQYLYESAHSVVLSLFAFGHSVAMDLVPWYTELLLAERQHLTVPQIRLAVSTLVRSVSTKDDAAAWWILLQITNAIESTTLAELSFVPSSANTSGEAKQSSGEHPSTLQLPPTAISPGTALTSKVGGNRLATNDDDHSGGDGDSNEDQTSLSGAADLQPFETVALRSSRGKLLITLIDQCTTVNLILFEKLMDTIVDLVSVEREREAWGRVVFEALSRGLDNVKREEGNKWWMLNSRRLYGLDQHADFQERQSVL